MRQIARNVWVILVIFVWLILCFCVAMVVMLVTLNVSVSIWMARKVWAPVLLWSAGSTLEVHGVEHVDPKRPTIYVSNHQSASDIPVLFMAIPCNLRFVAKKSLSYVPVLGWYMLLAGYVFVDRGNRTKAIASLERGAEKIRKGISLIMYAEGTRSEDGRILPFKKGPFALALKSGVAVCPVTIEGTGRMMPKGRFRITPTTVKVKIGKPIETSKYDPTDREKLIRDVRAVIVQQSLDLGGPGGMPGEDVAEVGIEGIGRPTERT
ncbi:MAG TPA: lysophospholipid acyltransferase family protein [Myxococcaceae bacterium]|nr:lysophospholipid acyltransferase family protein [Myxococcaceae bacterium]